MKYNNCTVSEHIHLENFCSLLMAKRFKIPKKLVRQSVPVQPIVQKAKGKRLQCNKCGHIWRTRNENAEWVACPLCGNQQYAGKIKRRIQMMH